MGSLARALASLPDDAVLTVGVSVTVRELREAFAAPSEFRVVTTGQAAELLGYCPDTWRAWAEAGEVHGAYRDDGEAGSWRLPFRGCEEHLARVQAGALNRRRKRGPREAALVGANVPELRARDEVRLAGWVA